MTDQAAPRRVMHSPRKVYVELTSRCNLRCKYCYYFGNDAVEYHDLSTDEWTSFFEEMGREGVMNLVLAGGEPLTRPDFRELIASITANKMRFGILTNGILITDDLAQFLAETGRCDYVQVSLDGSCAEAHDACRGAGSFDKAVAGIRAAQRHSLAITVRMTLTHHNVDDIDATARFLLDELGLPHFSTNSAGYFGTCRANEDVMVTAEDREKAMESLLGLVDRYGPRISATAGPLADATMWPKMIKAKAENAPAFDNGGRLTACGCPSSEITVRADGTIVPCSMLAHMELGRVNRESFVGIWQNSEPLWSLRERHSTPLTDFDWCSGCGFAPYCTGNCPGLAYTLTGQVHHPDPSACLRKYLREGARLPVRILSEVNG